MFSRFLPTGPNLEVFRFGVYVSMPILLMFYVGSNTHEKLNVVDFWPDPNRLNQIPKDRVELKMELARMREERLAKQKAAAAAAESADDEKA